MNEKLVVFVETNYRTSYRLLLNDTHAGIVHYQPSFNPSEAYQAVFAGQEKGRTATLEDALDILRAEFVIKRLGE